MRKYYEKPEIEMIRFDLNRNIMGNGDGNGDEWYAGETNQNLSDPETETYEDIELPW